MSPSFQSVKVNTTNSPLPHRISSPPQSFADVAILPEGVPANDFLAASDGLVQLFGQYRRFYRGLD